MQTIDSSRRQMSGGQARFRVLDPELPILAARAAIQFDRIIAGRPIVPGGTDDIKKLAGLFSTPGYENAAGNQLKSMIDPVSVDVFTRAYSQSIGAKLQSWNDLKNALQKVVELLNKKEVDNSKEQLNALRDFCIHLSDYSASQRFAVMGRTPKPSFSR